MSIRIGMGNGHNKPALVTYAKQLNCDSFCGMETQKFVGEFEAIPNHRVTVAREAWTEDKNRARSTLIMTHNIYPNLGELTLKVSERVASDLKFGPDRVLVCSMYEHPVALRMGWAGVAHIGLHPDATVKERDDNHPLVREYRESMTSLQRTIRYVTRERLLPIVTGDLQLGVDNRKPWSPYIMLVRDLNMMYYARGIDWVLWHNSLALQGRPQIKPLYDHPGIMVQLVRRTSR